MRLNTSPDLGASAHPRDTEQTRYPMETLWRDAIGIQSGRPACNDRYIIRKQADNRRWRGLNEKDLRGRGQLRDIK